MSDINKKRIAKNIVFLYAKVIVNMLLSLFTTRIVLNSLGASDYGIYGVVAGAVAMLGTLNSAMAQTTQRFMSYANGADNKRKLKEYFNASIIIHLVIGVCVFILMEIFFFPMFNGILNIPVERMFAAKVIYQFLVISTVFTILTVPYDSTINAHEDLGYYSVVGILESSLKLMSAVIIAYLFVDKLILYGFFLAMISVSMMIIMRIYCHKHYEECVFSLKKYAHKTAIIEMGKFAGWNFLGAFSSIAGNYGSTLLMNHFFGVIVNAAKSIADQLCGMVGVFSDNMMKAFNPVIVKQEGSGNREKMLDISLLSCRYSYLMYSLFAVPFCFEMPYILKVWLKNVPEWAVLFCQLQIIRTLLEHIGNPIRMSLMAEGHIKLMNISSLIVSLATFITLYILYANDYLPYWHFIISIFFMVCIDTCSKIILCKKYCNLSFKEYIVDVCLRCLSCSSLQFLLGWCLSNLPISGAIRFLVIFVTCSLGLIIGLLLVGMKKIESYYVCSIIKNKISNKYETTNKSEY